MLASLARSAALIRSLAHSLMGKIFMRRFHTVLIHCATTANNMRTLINEHLWRVNINDIHCDKKVNKRSLEHTVKMGLIARMSSITNFIFTIRLALERK